MILDANTLPIIIQKGNDYIKDFEKLKNDLSKEYNNTLKVDDIRVTGISDIQVALFHFVLSLTNINDNLIHFKWWDNHGYSNLTNDMKMQNAIRYFEVSTFACIHAAYAAYESTIRQYHFSLDNACHSESSGQISKVITCLVDKLKDNEYDGIDFMKFHDFFNDIRNTIHNHGVFRNPKYPLQNHTFLGKKYEFRHMIAPNFIFPDFVFDLLFIGSKQLKKIGTRNLIKIINYIPNLYRVSINNQSNI